MNWLSEQFSQHRLFRRLIMVYCCALVWVTTLWSFELARQSALEGMALAAVIAAIQAPVTMLLGHFLKLYSGSADK